MVTDPQTILLRLADVMEGMGLRYAIGGSLASGYYGEIRGTNDVDLLVELGLSQVGTFIRSLGPDFFVDAPAVFTAVQHGSSFSAVYVPLALKIDFFVATHGRLDRLQLSRRMPVQVDATSPQTVAFTSPEDVILRKLEWYRRCDRPLERQLRDAVGVLKTRGGTLDLDYLRATASSVGLTDQLEGVLRDAGMDH